MSAALDIDRGAVPAAADQPILQAPSSASAGWSRSIMPISIFGPPRSFWA
jgi:hypothetical protein